MSILDWPGEHIIRKRSEGFFFFFFTKKEVFYFLSGWRGEEQKERQRENPRQTSH